MKSQLYSGFARILRYGVGAQEKGAIYQQLMRFRHGRSRVRPKLHKARTNLSGTESQSQQRLTSILSLRNSTFEFLLSQLTRNFEVAIFVLLHRSGSHIPFVSWVGVY